MRRGGISVGERSCDDCGRVIKHPEQYLALDEEDVLPEDDIIYALKEKNPELYASLRARGMTLCLCADCALLKGYAYYRTDKGEKILTFFEKTASS
ncbi:hypothetical protein ACFLWX_01125 [Chloroflexota bacterium]